MVRRVNLIVGEQDLGSVSKSNGTRATPYNLHIKIDVSKHTSIRPL